MTKHRALLALTATVALTLGLAPAAQAWPTMATCGCHLRRPVTVEPRRHPAVPPTGYHRHVTVAPVPAPTWAK